MPLRFNGTLLSINQRPAVGAVVRVFDLDTPESSSDDLTIAPAPSSSGSGVFGGWFEPLWAPDTIMTTTSVTVWEPRNPGLGDFTPVRRTRTVTVPTPDTSDAYRPALDVRYRIGGGDYTIRRSGFAFLMTLPHVVNPEPVTAPLAHAAVDGGVFFVRSPDRRVFVVRGLSSAAVCEARELCAGSRRLASLQARRQADGRIVVLGIDDAAGAALATVEQGDGSFSSLSDFGGGLEGNFAVEANADGRLEMVARRADGALVHAWQTQPSGNWSNWSSLGGQLPFGSGIALIRDNQGNLNAFYNGNNAQIYLVRRTAAGWSGHRSLGGARVAGPLAVAQNADGRLELFAQGLEGDLWHIWQTATDWSAWESLGGVWVAGCLTATRHADGRLAVFAQRTDRRFAVRSQLTPNGTFGDWVTLGMPFTEGWSVPVPPADPVVVSRRANGVLVLSWRGAAGSLYTCEQGAANGGFSTWRSHGDVPPPPALASPQDISAMAGDGYVAVRWQAVAGAERYRVAARRVGGADLPSVETRSTQHTFSGLVNGVEIEVRVTALNRCHVGPASNAVRATPKAKADIVIVDVLPSESSPKTGRPFRVDVFVRNVGSASAPASRCRIEREAHLAEGGVQVPSADVTLDVPPLVPGEQRSVQWQQQCDVSATYYYTAFADVTNAVDELQEGNNTAVATVQVIM